MTNPEQPWRAELERLTVLFNAGVDRIDDEIGTIKGALFGPEYSRQFGAMERLGKLEAQTAEMREVQQRFVREQTHENEAKAKRDKRRDKWQAIAVSFISALLVGVLVAVFTLLMGGTP